LGNKLFQEQIASDFARIEVSWEEPNDTFFRRIVLESCSQKAGLQSRKFRLKKRREGEEGF
jgi:hypothetical protein